MLGTVLTKAAAAVVVNVFMRNENTEQILRSIILSRSRENLNAAGISKIKC